MTTEAWGLTTLSLVLKTLFRAAKIEIMVVKGNRSNEKPDIRILVVFGRPTMNLIGICKRMPRAPVQ